MDKKPDNQPEGISDEQLEEYLEGNTPLSQQYRAAEQAEPPAALDRAILDEAREEVQPPIIDTGSFTFWRHWMRPVTIVLTMGVSLAVVLEIMNTANQLPVGLTEAEPMLVDELDSREAKAIAPPAARYDMLVGPEPSARMSADSPDMAFDVRRQAAADKSRKEELLAAKQAPVAERPAYMAEQEITVTARKREQSLQDVPMAVTAIDADELRKSAASDKADMAGAGPLEEIAISTDDSLADNALAAWESGAKPSANAWLAGIQAMIEDDEAEFASHELERMAEVYPDEAKKFRADTKLPPYVAAAGAPQGQLEAISVTPTREKKQPLPTDNIADAWVWAAGIEWLYDNGDTAAADAEAEKFQQIYPNF